MILAALLQVVLGLALPSPWWAPDLVLAAMVRRIFAQPSHWVEPAAAGAVWYGVWALRAAPQTALACMAVAAALAIVAGHIDGGDWRVQGWLTACACAVLQGWALWAESRWSLPLVGLSVARVGLTAGSSLLWGMLPRGGARAGWLVSGGRV